ncbi:MAG: hypothetical protein MI919_35530, partial [Holophagales bacterium]|nr:hypothetical protein [Holophagales bacterium]
TAVPWSRVGATYRRVCHTFDELPVLCHLSHPYADGVSLYFTFFFASSGDAEADIATWAAWKRKAQEALVEAGAATSHHHGVGSWHAPWAGAELGETGTRLLASVARELDPAGVLNSHVLLDPEDRLEL